MYDYVLAASEVPLSKIEGPSFDYAGDVAKKLCVVKKTGTRPVSAKVKKRFRKEYEKYVERRLGEFSGQSVIIVFQEPHSPLKELRPKNNGRTYIEDNLKEVIKCLPYLQKGERYSFPALRIIVNPENLEFFVIR